ncbi:MAG: hypothetical protein WCX82_00365 [archaeon]|jgi:1-deoxy-D-xylulose 5-phosphate reductoisomerase
MITKILVLGSQRKKSQDIISFFSKYPNKYKISGLMCTDEKQLDFFKQQIKKLKPEVVFFPNKEQAQQIAEDFNIKCFSDNLQYTQFLKISNCDLVVSDLTGIDSIKLILATVGEYKDICLLNLEPILYSGKIIINEAKNKGVKLQFITHQFYSFDLFFKYKNNLTNINKVILTNYDSIYDKENLENYASSSKSLSEFKKILYFKNKMWLGRHLIVLSNVYDLESNTFEYYKSNTDSLSLILQLKTGSNYFNLTDNNKEVIYNYYYLNSQNTDIKLNLEKNIDIKLQKIKAEDIISLDLANQALKKGGSYPIIYQMAYDLCAEGMYLNKIKNKNCFMKVFTEMLEDKTFYSKNANIQTIFALYERVKEKINADFIKTKKTESKK